MKIFKVLKDTLRSKINIEYSFFILIGFLGILSFINKDVNIFIIYSILYATIYLHELAHVFAAKYFSLNTGSINFNVLGGNSEINISNIKSNYQLIIIAAAGPLVNIVFTFVFYYLNLIFNIDILNKLFILSLIVSISNLLPVVTLDGFLIFKSLLKILKINYFNVKLILKITSITICLLGCIICIITSYIFAFLLFSILLMYSLDNRNYN